MKQEMIDYKEAVFRELEIKGLTRKDANTITRITDFSVENYPEIMEYPADEQADRMIVVGATLLQVRRLADIPKDEKSDLLNRLVCCIRSAGLVDQYTTAKEEMRRMGQTLMEIAV